MVITAVVKRADPRTANGVMYPPTCNKTTVYLFVAVKTLCIRIINDILKIRNGPEFLISVNENIVHILH